MASYRFFAAALLSVTLITAVKSQATDCNPPDCNGKGVCNSATKTCDCNPPFSGTDCTERDPCQVQGSDGAFVSRDCGANGKCEPSPKNPRKSICKCQLGYYGNECELVNYCILDPDLNPWPPGDPCQHDGQCYSNYDHVNETYDARCVCKPPYVGVYCEFVDPCHFTDPSSHPCHSRGECKTVYDKGSGVQIIPKKTCGCALGYDRVTFCEKRDPCVLADGTTPICKNGARCKIDRTGTDLVAVCSCRKHYDGPYCERVNKCGIPASKCNAAASRKNICNPCRNGGKCISTLEPVPASIPIPNFKDTHHRVHTCDCSQTSYHGEFCEILKTGVIIVPADHKGAVTTAHVNSFEAKSGYTHIYYIVALAFGDEGEIMVDTGDGFHFQLSLEAMQSISEENEVLSALRDIEDKDGHHSALYYPLRHTYMEGTYTMKVQILNGGTQSDEKITNINVVLPDNVACVPYSQLKNVGHIRTEMTEYKRTDTFVVEASLRFDCFEQDWLMEQTPKPMARTLSTPEVEIGQSNFRFEWKLYKLTHMFPSPTAENDMHVEHLANTTEKYLRFGPYVLLDGTYWVECRAYVKKNGVEYGNSEKGFFRINLNSPRIILRHGNDRTVDGRFPITLDASLSVDDSFPDDSPFLQFSWECMPSCGHGPWEGAVVSIPEGTFEGGSAVSIFLRATSSHAKTQASANIALQVTEKASISVACTRNCKWFNPGDEVVFECSYTVDGEPGGASNIKWSWFPTDEIYPDSVRDEPQLISIILPSTSTNIITRSLQCSATPPGLQQEIKATADFKINEPPIGGPCTVSPTTGTYLVTEFSISCAPFVDTSLPLTYTFLVEVDRTKSELIDNLGNRLILGHCTNPKLINIYLPFGDYSKGNANDAIVNVVVQVTDSLGLSSEILIPVVVNLPPTSDYQRLFSELISSDNSLMRKRFLRGDYQGAMQLQMAGLYGLLDTTISSELTTDEMDHALTVIQKTSLITPLHSFKANEQLLYSTHLMDRVESRVDPEVLLTISRTTNEAASKLVQFAKDANEVTSSAELETLADALTDSGSRLLGAAVKCVDNLNQQPAILLTCNERNVLDFDSGDENDPDTFSEASQDEFSSAEKEELHTTSDSADKNVQECSKSSRNALRAMRAALDGALGHLGVAVFYGTVTDAVSTRAQIMSEVNSNVSIKLKTSDTTKDTEVKIAIPGDALEIMQGRIDTDTAKLELQAISTTYNAFVDDTSACPSTATVHLSVKDSESHVPVMIKNLENPIEVSLPILKPLSDAEVEVGKSENQAVQILAVDELDDYYEIPTFHMFLPYNSKVLVKIVDKSSDSMIFKVVAMKGRRPIFSDYCRENTAIDVDETTNTAVFFTDRLDWNEEPEESLIDYHISVLVFDFHNVHRQEEFSVAFSRYSCLYRDEDRKFWSEKGCMVSNDSTMASTSASDSPMNLARMKCLCNHASIISGVQLVIPHTIDHSNVINDFTIDEIENNPVVLITVCVILAVYLIATILCRWFDLRDAKQDVGLTIMADLKVKNEGTQFYLITFVTGCNFWAGTTSAVSVVIYGSGGRSKMFTLKDRSNTVFLRGDVDTFLVACDKDLGALEKIRIWIDHTGVDPSWYCRKVLIRSVTPDKAWHFYVNRWLTVTAEESTVILEIPATTKEERKRFLVRYKENLLEQIDNVNLWVSIFRYSPASNFTRCQRLGCAFATLTGQFLIDILFHGTPTEDEEGLFEIGEYAFDFYKIIKAMEVGALSLPFGFILISLFRNIRSRYTPTLIIWEGVVPATMDKKRFSLYIPQKEDEKAKGNIKEKIVQLPKDSAGHKVKFEPSSADDLIESDIDLRLHPDKLDRLSKASTTASGFSIPSTDIPKLEDWIQDRVQEDDPNYPSSNGVQSGAETDENMDSKPARHSNPQPPSDQYPFIQSVDSLSAIGSGSNEQDTLFRLGRRAMISSVRDYDPDTFIFQGENDIHQLEDLIDKQIKENRLSRGSKDKKNSEEAVLGISQDEEMGKKEIILGQKKDSSFFKRIGDKTPWKKAVTTKYLERIDQELEQELANKQFMQDKANWESQTALEMCQLRVEVNQPSHSSWPWWFIFFAWGACLLTIFTCLYFTLLYGIHYGYLRSLMWLETLILSFFNNMFITQPMTAVLFTAFSTLLGKRLRVKERLQVVVEKSGSTASYLASRLPYKFNLFRPIRICEPLRGNQIFRLTIAARRKKELNGKLIRLILCILLLIPLIAVSYSGHNHYNYEVTRNIRSMFQVSSLGTEKVRFHSKASVYTYLEKVLVANIHPSRYYNGEHIPATAPTLLSDQQTLLVGVARIRQQRVKPSDCPPPLGTENDNIFAAETGTVLCNKDFTRATQDRDSYDPAWEPLDRKSGRNPSSLSNDGWEFHAADSEKSKSLTFRGQQGTYDGGGYILQLGRNRRQSLSVIKYMKKTNWLDSRTRAIFVELTLMNPNINKFADVVVLAEQGPTGTFSLTSWISAVELIPIEDLKRTDELAWVSFSMVAIVVILLVWFGIFLREHAHNPKNRRYAPTSFWLELIIIVFVFISLLISLVRFVAAKEVADLIEKQKEDDYLSIQRAAHWNHVQRDMFSVTQALIFIKLWKLLMFTDKRFLTFALTLKLTSGYMWAFVMTLAILLGAFATFAFFLFGQDLWEFSSWGESLVSLVDQMLGSSFFKRLIIINPVLGPAFVFLFGYFVIFIGLNFVVALLDLGVHEAKEVVQQRRAWLTYFRYFKETLIKTFVVVNSAKRQELSDLVMGEQPAAASSTVHPDRWHGMKMATAKYIREFLVAAKASKMMEMQRYCNELLAGTGYRMVGKRAKAQEKDLVKQRHIEQLRRMTSVYIQDKLGHEMQPKEFKEYADFNQQIVKLRIQKMEKTLEKLVERVDEFVLRHSARAKSGTAGDMERPLHEDIIFS